MIQIAVLALISPSITAQQDLLRGPFEEVATVKAQVQSVLGQVMMRDSFDVAQQFGENRMIEYDELNGTQRKLDIGNWEVWMNSSTRKVTRITDTEFFSPDLPNNTAYTDRVESARLLAASRRMTDLTEYPGFTIIESRIVPAGSLVPRHSTALQTDRFIGVVTKATASGIPVQDDFTVSSTVFDSLTGRLVYFSRANNPPFAVDPALLTPRITLAQALETAKRAHRDAGVFEGGTVGVTHWSMRAPFPASGPWPSETYRERALAKKGQIFVRVTIQSVDKKYLRTIHIDGLTGEVYNIDTGKFR